MTLIQTIHHFWFGDGSHLDNASKWFKKDPQFDFQVKSLFSDHILRAARGEYDEWKESAQGSLSFVILLDQFSRNAFRDTSQAFSQDPIALAAALASMEQGFDQSLNDIERHFLYMPLMHSEDAAIQQKSVETFLALSESAAPEYKKSIVSAYNFALQHKAVIDRFGRYPHRNAVLGRKSTAEELEFLQQPGSSF